MARHFILDGYNIIRQTPGLGDLAIDAGREKLIQVIERHRPQGSSRNKITVVLDGRPGRSTPTVSESVEVIFTYDATADEHIKNRVATAAHPRNMVVVTNDRDIQYYVKAHGAEVWTVQDFMGKLKREPAKGASGAIKKIFPEGKMISSALEYKINQELEKVWLKE